MSVWRGLRGRLLAPRRDVVYDLWRCHGINLDMCTKL